MRKIITITFSEMELMMVIEALEHIGYTVDQSDYYTILAKELQKESRFKYAET